MMLIISSLFVVIFMKQLSILRPPNLRNLGGCFAICTLFVEGNCLYEKF